MCVLQLDPWQGARMWPVTAAVVVVIRSSSFFYYYYIYFGLDFNINFFDLCEMLCRIRFLAMKQVTAACGSSHHAVTAVMRQDPCRGSFDGNSNRPECVHLTGSLQRKTPRAFLEKWVCVQANNSKVHALQ